MTHLGQYTLGQRGQTCATFVHKVPTHIFVKVLQHQLSLVYCRLCTIKHIRWFQNLLRHVVVIIATSLKIVISHICLDLMGLDGIFLMIIVSLTQLVHIGNPIECSIVCSYACLTLTSRSIL